MTHNTTVTPELYTLLQAELRHLILKHDPLFMPDDIIMVSQPDSREQIEFVINTIDKLNTRTTLLGLYAPYNSNDDLPETVG